MNKLKRSVYKFSPQMIRQRICRYMLPVFQLNIEGVKFYTAQTPQDYLGAFNLVYKVFVRSGYTEPGPTPFRLAPQHCHPDSRVFIARSGPNNESENIVFSISIFPDSSQGLPMDSVFKNELDKLRDEGRVLVEAGHLAADPGIKADNMNIPMLGNKMLHYYASEQQSADNIVIAVHPKHVWVYEDLLLFTKIGEVSSYSYANNNPAVAMQLDLRTAKSSYRNFYKSFPLNKNLYHFFFETISESIVLPEKNRGVDIRLLEAMKYFYGGTFREK